jgi:hypothetical protein
MEEQPGGVLEHCSTCGVCKTYARFFGPMTAIVLTGPRQIQEEPVLKEAYIKMRVALDEFALLMLERTEINGVVMGAPEVGQITVEEINDMTKEAFPDAESEDPICLGHDECCPCKTHPEQHPECSCEDCEIGRAGNPNSCPDCGQQWEMHDDSRCPRTKHG